MIALILYRGHGYLTWASPVAAVSPGPCTTSGRSLSMAFCRLNDTTDRWNGLGAECGVGGLALDWACHDKVVFEGRELLPRTHKKVQGLHHMIQICNKTHALAFELFTFVGFQGSVR